MSQNMEIIVVADGWVNPHMYTTDLRHAKVDEIPFGPVIRNGGDFIALFEAHGQQTQTKFVNMFSEVGGAE